RRVDVVVEQVAAVRHLAVGEGRARARADSGRGRPGGAVGAGDRKAAGAVHVRAGGHIDVAEGESAGRNVAVGGDGRAGREGGGGGRRRGGAGCKQAGRNQGRPRGSRPGNQCLEHWIRSFFPNWGQ